MIAEMFTQYTAGTAERYPRNGRIPIDIGDTCIVVGGKAFLEGNKIHMSWPSVHSSIPVALPCDIPFFRNQSIAVDEVKPIISPLEFAQPSTSELAEKMKLEISENQVYRRDGIRYRGIDKNNIHKLKKVYELCFGYPIAPDVILALFTQTGGHLGGIFEGEEMIGFTTILAGQLPHIPDSKSLFVDSVGVRPDKRHLKLGSFALNVVELAAKDAGLSHVSLTHHMDLTSFYKTNGFEQISYLENVYGPGESRYYSVKDLNKNQNV